jgi:hypothetical protein
MWPFFRIVTFTITSAVKAAGNGLSAVLMPECPVLAQMADHHARAVNLELVAQACAGFDVGSQTFYITGHVGVSVSIQMLLESGIQIHMDAGRQSIACL